MQEEAEIAVAQVNGSNGEASQPQPGESSANGGEQPAAVNGSQAEANGDSKKAKKEKKEKREKVQEPKEPPKSLQEDPVDWIKHHAGLANHKANYDLLGKIAACVEEDESKQAAMLPGKPDAISNGQFISAFADGQLASMLVKKLSIIAAVPTVEGEEELKKKENQIALLQAFADFAKTEGGVPEEKLPAVADVQEAKKSAYPALFATLVTVLGNKGEVSAEQLANDAVKYAEENRLSRKARTVVSQISHSFSNLKLSLQRKKSSSCEAGHENGVAEKTNGVAEEKAENGNGESSHAPNGNVATEEPKSEAVAAN